MTDIEYITFLLECAYNIAEKLDENEAAKWSLRIERVRQEILFSEQFNHNKRYKKK